MLLTILAIIVPTLAALIPAVYYVYFRIPKLDIEILYDWGSSKPLGYSSKNNTQQAIAPPDMIYIYEAKWEFKVIIRNNSEFTAFYPRLYFSEKSLKFDKITALNRLIPIKATEHLELKAEIIRQEEKTGGTRTDTGRLPADMSNIIILLEYQNITRLKFYTLFDYHDRKHQNVLKRFCPKEFKGKPTLIKR